jgi:hypothetical protein
LPPPTQLIRRPSAFTAVAGLKVLLAFSLGFAVLVRWSLTKAASRQHEIVQDGFGNAFDSLNRLVRTLYRGSDLSYRFTGFGNGDVVQLNLSI